MEPIGMPQEELNFAATLEFKEFNEYLKKRRNEIEILRNFYYDTLTLEEKYVVIEEKYSGLPLTHASRSDYNFHSLDTMNLSLSEIDYLLHADFLDGFKMLYRKVEGKDMPGPEWTRRRKSIFFDG